MTSQIKESRDQKTQDVEIDAANVVRTIFDIERAYIVANGELSERLMSEIQAALRAAVAPPWMVGEANGSVTLQHTSWRSSANITHNDAWLELTEIAEDDQDHSWIAAVTGTGATRTGFELRFRPGLSQRMIAPAESKRAAELGFEVLGDGEAVFLPLTLDRDILARAFESGNFAEALSPVLTALAEIISAADELDRLIGLVRKRNGKAK